MKKRVRRKNPYYALAGLYDLWQEDADPAARADHIESFIKKHCEITQGQGRDGKLLLVDLGCGTGEIAHRMAQKGYDVIGVDESPEMLAQAYLSQDDMDTRFICQDICDMDLFGTADIMICLMDTINHITDPERVDRFFALCKKFLTPRGILIFDIATLHHFKHTLGNNSFTETGEGYAIIWENSYNEKKALNEAFVTVFTIEANGNYERDDSVITERFYEPEQIEEMITANALTVEAFYPDNEDKEQAERIFYVAKNSSDPQKEKLMKDLQ